MNFRAYLVKCPLCQYHYTSRYYKDFGNLKRKHCPNCLEEVPIVKQRVESPLKSLAIGQSVDFYAVEGKAWFRAVKSRIAYYAKKNGYSYKLYLTDYGCLVRRIA